MLTYADVCRRLSCSICVTCSRIWTRMRWLVCYYVSSYYYVCVRIPLYLCVLILLHMCPHTTIYVCSYCCVCARVSYYKYVSSFYYMCVLILLDICAHTTIGALTQQYVCSHAIKSVCSFHYVCVLILSYMCPHTTTRRDSRSRSLFRNELTLKSQQVADNKPESSLNRALQRTLIEP